jgi:hypothetical protein
MTHVTTTPPVYCAAQAMSTCDGLTPLSFAIFSTMGSTGPPVERKRLFSGP